MTQNTLISSEKIFSLKSAIQGKVIQPADTDYDAVRQVFLGGVDSHPAVIVQVLNPEDVKHTIRFAKENNVPLAVRSGGHSSAAHSTVEGGVVLDLRLMKKISIDENAKTVWAETGLTAMELTNAADKHGLVIGFGDTGSVGIGGITLGGGVGFLARKFGLAIDNLLAARIVTADGELLEVNAQSHPDLFWAIRGGGGNFGVVTEFQYQLHDLPQAYGGMMILPASGEGLTKYMELSEQAPNELSSIINVMPCPPMPFVPAEHHGKLIMMALMMYAGDPAEGEKVLAPFRAIATPIADMVKSMKYAEMFHPDDPSYRPKAAAQTMFMKQVDLEMAKTIVERLTAYLAPMRVVQLRPLEGKVAEVPSDATAYAHRQSKIMVNIASFYETDEEKKNREQWIAEFAKLLNQGDNGKYVNFVGFEGPQHLQEMYPEPTLEKLKNVKKQYDPQNFFKLNQNIKPA